MSSQIGSWIGIGLLALGCGQEPTAPAEARERVSRADGVTTRGKPAAPLPRGVRATHVSPDRLPTLTLDVGTDPERTVVTLPKRTQHQLTARRGEDGRLYFDCAQGGNYPGGSHLSASHSRTSGASRGDEY